MEEPRPEFLTDEHLAFLDELRESGEINMFGAAPYLSDVFDLSKQEARKVLTYWMQTFGTRKDKGLSMDRSSKRNSTWPMCGLSLLLPNKKGQNHERYSTKLRIKVQRALEPDGVFEAGKAERANP